MTTNTETRKNLGDHVAAYLRACGALTASELLDKVKGISESYDSDALDGSLATLLRAGRIESHGEGSERRYSLVATERARDTLKDDLIVTHSGPLKLDEFGGKVERVVKTHQGSAHVEFWIDDHRGELYLSAEVVTKLTK